MIRVDAVWLAIEPIDLRLGPESALARVVTVFGAAHPHRRAPILILLAFVLMPFVYWIFRKPYAGCTLYRNVEEGENSALYIRATRIYDWAGGVTFEYYKRITCAPGQRYTAATSDWFQPWDGWSNQVIMHFKAIPEVEAQKLLAEQLPITRTVAKGLALGRKAGTLRSGDGFAAPAV